VTTKAVVVNAAAT